jgi:cytochrome P450
VNPLASKARSTAASLAAGSSTPERRLASCVKEIRDDRYRAYRRFREQDPVHCERSEDPESPDHWYVFRHADAVATLTDDLLGKRPPATPAAQAPRGPYSELVSRWFLLLDPPEHGQLRSSLAHAFCPSVVQRMRPRVEALSNELLDRAAARGCMDLIADYAFPLPIEVMAELLGLRREARSRLRQWSLTLAEAIDCDRTPAALARADRAVGDIRRYFRAMLRERRARPSEDLLSALVSPSASHAPLGDGDIVANTMLLVFAGHETTTNLIGNGILALLQNPDQLELLRGQPERIAGAIEELLRYDAPIQLTTRIVQRDHVLAGARMRQGDRVQVLLGSANRDPEVFRNPDRLDVTRTDVRHLAFGLGSHYCLGAALGRLEGEVALAALIRRFPRMRLASERVDWRRSVVFRGLERLPLLL